MSVTGIPTDEPAQIETNPNSGYVAAAGLFLGPGGSTETLMRLARALADSPLICHHDPIRQGTDSIVFSLSQALYDEYGRHGCHFNLSPSLFQDE